MCYAGTSLTLRIVPNSVWERGKELSRHLRVVIGKPPVPKGVIVTVDMDAYQLM